ncbi:unnamed protein product, partial [Ectocarpus sp. 8 AP-2014]
MCCSTRVHRASCTHTPLRSQAQPMCTYTCPAVSRFFPTSDSQVRLQSNPAYCQRCTSTHLQRHVKNNNYSTTYFGKITYLSQKLLLCKSTFSRSNYSNKDGPLRDLPYNKRRLPRNCSALIFLARDPLPSHSQGPENNEALKKSNSKPKSSCDWSNTKNNAVRFLFPTELNFCFNFFDFCSFGPSLVRSLTQKQTG